MVALALTTLAIYHLTRWPNWRTLMQIVLIPALFWGYFGGYYIVTRPPYFGDLAAKPGLFFAWIIVLVGLAVFLRTATPAQTRLTFAVPLGVAFGITVINAITDVFPGTASTQPHLLLYVSPLIILAVFMVWGAPLALVDQHYSPIVLAIVLAPIPFIGFAFSAGLSPEYSLFARRAQTFGHVSIAIMAALAVGNVACRGDSHAIKKFGIPVILLIAVIVSAPLAFAGPPVIPYQSTTTNAEFETITFTETHIEGTWTSDDHPTRVARNYYDADTTRSPTLGWLQGGTPPKCPILIRDSWNSVGAVAVPADPIPAEATTLETFIKRGQAVYDGGPDSNGHTLVVPVQISDSQSGSC
ncbi:hypothetical protein SAMN05216226_112120 [Halovenus aranensis]|uniref:Uncharacterized protein n=1 Tax=Halovenus aranensis TaxID=890420 RepID=A0A1G8XWY5_9EURY|nr:hypothetical protein [Halovenus aranensis]SDJ95011.1 hypothetical protein SAMN05216226_112120 [Halovenus aranensis]